MLALAEAGIGYGDQLKMDILEWLGFSSALLKAQQRVIPSRIANK